MDFTVISLLIGIITTIFHADGLSFKWPFDCLKCQTSDQTEDSEPRPEINIQHIASNQNNVNQVMRNQNSLIQNGHRFYVVHLYRGQRFLGAELYPIRRTSLSNYRSGLSTEQNPNMLSEQSSPASTTSNRSSDYFSSP